jgi:hypothetical protein
VTTAVDEDVEVIKFLDFEEELPCETGRNRCERAAVWLLRCRSCRWTLALCEPHREREAREADAAVLTVCPKCFMGSPTFEGQFEITPLRPRS